jgi:ABC-type cobalamin/Fe3+-siderophores transport system ATPase subunit
LNLLSGVLQPEHGHVSLNGASLAGRSRRDIARHLAVVPQETHPAFDYTVMEMVLMGRHPHLGVVRARGTTRSRTAGARCARRHRHRAPRRTRLHDAQRR